MNNFPIGIFDSGVGGLSIFQEVKKELPKESIVYLADRGNFPYGRKTTKQLKKIAKNNVQFLLKKKAKLIVVACNTATVKTLSFLRRKFPQVQFVGLEPAIKPAGLISKKGVLVLASPQASKSKQVKMLIKKYIKNKNIFNIGCLSLVEAIEHNIKKESLKKILKKCIKKEILDRIDVIVLGCTHFPLVKNEIKLWVGKRVKIVDSGKAIVQRIKLLLKTQQAIKENKPFYKFYTTGELNQFGEIKFNKIKT